MTTYKRILVPLKGTAVDPDVIRLAMTIGRPSKAQITAVHVIEVPWNQPLDAVLDKQLEQGELVLADAAKLGKDAGAEIATELLQARDPGAAIVDTARERQVDLIVLGMPFRKRLGRTYVGRIVQDVYLGAPCAVVAYRQEEPR